MDPLQLVITNGGIAALVDAQSGETDAIRIAEIGLTATAFDAAPTLVALPGELARIDSVHGQSVAENVIHMTATDASAAVYDLRGVGLYLADGTLFATYGQDDPLFRKVSIASFLLAFDVKFSGDVADVIEFGDANFTYPPATEAIRGVAKIATQARVDAEEDAGDDAETIVTPKTLRARLAAFFAAVEAAIDAFIAAIQQQVDDLTASVNASLAGFAARTVTGEGLATGGGDLTANRTITVTEATAAQVTAGTAHDVVLTPGSVGPVGGSFGTFGYARLPGGLIIQWGRVTMGATEYAKPVVLPLTFPNAILSVVASYGSYPAGSDDESDEHLWALPTSNGEVTVYGYSADDYAAREVLFHAIGY